MFTNFSAHLLLRRNFQHICCTRFAFRISTITVFSNYCTIFFLFFPGLFGTLSMQFILMLVQLMNLLPPRSSICQNRCVVHSITIAALNMLCTFFLHSLVFCKFSHKQLILLDRNYSPGFDKIVEIHHFSFVCSHTKFSYDSSY